MRRLRMIALVAMTATALAALLGAGSASGTELYKSTEDPDITQGVGAEIQGSLKAGESLAFKDTFGYPVATCTGSEIGMKTESAGGEAAHPSGKVSTLSFSGCPGPVTVHLKGGLEIKHIAGTTNGTVTSSGMEMTLEKTAFGDGVCKVGPGADLGFLKGVEDAKSHATLVLNALMECFGLSFRLVGAYTITTATGLNVEAAPKSGSELYRSTEDPDITQGVGAEIQGSLKAGSSFALRDTFGYPATTCTGSEVGMKIESAGGEAAHPSGKVTTLAFSGCNDSVTVHSKGTLEIKHVAGTTNGTVTSSGMDVTFNGIFGYLNCKTGAGADIGALMGVANQTHATLNVDVVLNCGLSVRLLAIYTITTPTGLNVEAK